MIDIQCHGQDRIGRRGCCRGMSVEPHLLNIIHTVIQGKAEWLSWTCPHCQAANVIHRKATGTSEYAKLFPHTRLSKSIAEPKIETAGGT